MLQPYLRKHDSAIRNLRHISEIVPKGVVKRGVMGKGTERGSPAEKGTEKKEKIKNHSKKPWGYREPRQQGGKGPCRDASLLLAGAQ